MNDLLSSAPLPVSRVHMESGYAFNPPQPTVRPGNTELCSFTKQDNSASGTVGVLTYELCNPRIRCCDGVMAVMFSVPYDYNFSKNWLAVGIFNPGQACNEKLYKEMYNSKDNSYFNRREANGSGLIYKGKEMDVLATMSDEGRAVIKLEMYESWS